MFRRAAKIFILLRPLLQIILFHYEANVSWEGLENTPQVKLTNKGKVHSCGQVYSNGNDSYVLIEVEKWAYPNVSLYDLTLPVAIFKYSDIAYYDDFHTPRGFGDMSRSLKGRLKLSTDLKQFDEQEIELKKYDIMDTLRFPNIVNDYLVYPGKENKKIKYEVDLPGVYCVYVVPPLFRGNMTVSVTYANSYGYLRYEDYVQYRLLKFTTIFGVVLFAVMFYYYRYVICNSSTMFFTDIYRGLLFYCLGPLIIVSVLKIIPDTLINNTFPNDKLRMFYSMKLGTELISDFLVIHLFRYMLFFYNKGYGIFCENSESGSSNRPWKVIIRLFPIVDILLTTINVLRPFNILPLLETTWKILSLYIANLPKVRFVYSWEYFRQTMINVITDNVFKQLDVELTVFHTFAISCLCITFTEYGPLDIMSSFPGLFCRFKANSYRKRLEKVLEGARLNDISQKLAQEDYIFKGFHWPNTLEYYMLIIVVFLLWFRISKIISKKIALKEKKVKNE